jgi:hypothetical protein
MRCLNVVSAAVVLFVMIAAVACVEAPAPAQTPPPTAPVQAAQATAEPTQAPQPTQAPEPGQAPQPTQAPEPMQASQPTQAPEPGQAPQPTQASEPTNAPVATPASEAGASQLAVFNPNNFGHSNIINNEWLPLKPGTRLTYEGYSVADNGTVVPHRIAVNVTDLTKSIGGVRTLVTWDQDYQAEKLVEAELAFYAQDKDGNVWYVGEYPEVYEDGKLVEAPTWIHGLKGARAGIMMKAKPQLGTPAYAEGLGPAVGWTDVGQVDQMGQTACVPVSCYHDVLVIAETSQAEPDAQQLKYYARSVGNVQVGWRGQGEKTKETLVLTKIEQLSPGALAEVRANALELEKGAYVISKSVYGRTPPLEQSAPGN